MMSIVKMFFVVFAMVCSTVIIAQVKVNPDIQKKLDAYIDLSNQKNWNQAFDLMYPKLFSQVPKQDLVDMMTSMESDGLSLKMSNVKMESSSVPYEDGKETYVRVEYTANLTVQVADGSLYSTPKAIQSVTTQFQNQYGKSNVKWDPVVKRYNILAHKSIMAVNYNNQWYIVEINKDQMELMEFLFPESIMDALVRIG